MSDVRETQRPQLRVLLLPEILEMILLNLPVQDLLLAQAVCKTWKMLIDSSLHIQRALFFVPSQTVLHYHKIHNASCLVGIDQVGRVICETEFTSAQDGNSNGNPAGAEHHGMDGAESLNDNLADGNNAVDYVLESNTDNTGTEIDTHDGSSLDNNDLDQEDYWASVPQAQIDFMKAYDDATATCDDYDDFAFTDHVHAAYTLRNPHATNPWLHVLAHRELTLWPYYMCLPRLHSRLDDQNQYYCFDENDKKRHSSKKWWRPRNTKHLAAAAHPDASWRRMLVTQPPLPRYRVLWRACLGPPDEPHLPCIWRADVESEEGVRLEDIDRAVIEWREGKPAFGIEDYRALIDRKSDVGQHFYTYFLGTAE